MPSLGVNTAIIEMDEILLTKRVDFEVWCLPGGGVDPGESLAQAAIRETREETGLEVLLTRLVGVYSRPAWMDGGLHVVVFAAQALGGCLRAQPDEVMEMRYFRPDELPREILFGHRQRIQDALSGLRGVAWAQNAQWPFGPEVTRPELYRLRDSSGLSPAEFYLQYAGRPASGGDWLEVRGSES
jgi:ADP-ribose pyrophosphatase YjhB (NUDIX family)